MIALSTAASTILKLGNAGFQRIGSIAFQKMLRVYRIDSALKGKIARSPVVKAAVDDFQTVIGNFYGLFDQQLAEFLAEVERSGLITLMIEDAILRRQSEATVALFGSLHSRIFGSDVGESAQLFNKMSKAFEVSVAELCQDKGLAEYLRAIHHDLESKLNTIEESLKILAREKSPLDYQEIKACYPKFAKGLSHVFRDVRIETNKGPRLVEIRKIYVAPQMQYRRVVGSVEKIVDISKKSADRRARQYI